MSMFIDIESKKDSNATKTTINRDCKTNLQNRYKQKHILCSRTGIRAGARAWCQLSQDRRFRKGYQSNNKKHGLIRTRSNTLKINDKGHQRHIQTTT